MEMAQAIEAHLSIKLALLCQSLHALKAAYRDTPPSAGPEKNEPYGVGSAITVLTPLYDPLVAERLGEGQVDRWGRVQYVLGGERRFFDDWSTLVEYLEAKLQELDAEETS